MNNENKYLDRIQSKKPYYPDGAFFDELAKNIIAEQQETVFKKSIYKRPFVQWIAAAAVIPLILFLVFHKSENPSQSAFVMLDNVPSATISEYVKEQQSPDVSLAVLSSSVNESSWSSESVEEMLESLPVNEISSYLDEEYDDWDSEYLD